MSIQVKFDQHFDQNLLTELSIQMGSQPTFLSNCIKVNHNLPKYFRFTRNLNPNY